MRNPRTCRAYFHSAFQYTWFSVAQPFVCKKCFRPSERPCVHATSSLFVDLNVSIHYCKIRHGENAALVDGPFIPFGPFIISINNEVYQGGTWVIENLQKKFVSHHLTKHYCIRLNLDITRLRCKSYYYQKTSGSGMRKK